MYKLLKREGKHLFSPLAPAPFCLEYDLDRENRAPLGKLFIYQAFTSALDEAWRQPGTEVWAVKADGVERVSRILPLSASNRWMRFWVEGIKSDCLRPSPPDTWVAEVVVLQSCVFRRK